MIIKSEKIRDVIIEVTEELLRSQLFALRKLKKGEKEYDKQKQNKSQLDMAWEVLKKEGAPLHITEIIKGIEKLFGKKIDRESLVSAIIKKVLREDRFIRTGRNTYFTKEK